MTEGPFHRVLVRVQSQSALGRRGWLTPWQRVMLGAQLALIAGLTAAKALLPTELGHDWQMPLTASEKQMFHGASVYRRACAMCHDVTGLGRPGLGTPLVASPWLKRCQDEELSAILLHGVMGPIPGTYSRHPVMPGMASWLTDPEIADVATYVLKMWGQRSRAIAAETVRSVRRSHPGRVTPWTLEEWSKRMSFLPKISQAP